MSEVAQQVAGGATITKVAGAGGYVVKVDQQREGGQDHGERVPLTSKKSKNASQKRY